MEKELCYILINLNIMVNGREIVEVGMEFLQLNKITSIYHMKVSLKMINFMEKGLSNMMSKDFYKRRDCIHVESLFRFIN